jgi:O-antigen/teichoic acid export membrane protein
MPAAGHMESLRGRASQGVRWNGASMLASTVLQITLTAALARMLPPSQFGLLGLVLVATGFAQALSDFGLGGAIIYRQTTDQGQLSSLFWANTLGGAGIFALCAAAGAPAALLYGEPMLATLLPAAGLSFLAAPLGQPMTAILQRDLRFRRLFFCEFAASGSRGSSGTPSP